MNDQQFRIIVNKGPEPGKVFELTSVSMTIGRDPMAEITINDPEVSRRHARLIGTVSGYRIQDLGSTNGTFVDGIRLSGEPLSLEIGHVICIGSSVVLVYRGMADEEAASVTLLDTTMAPLETQEQEEQPDNVGIDSVVDEPPISQESRSTVDENDGVGIDSVSEEDLDQLPTVEPFRPAANWESSLQDETPTSYQEEPDAYVAEVFSEPMVIPNQSESAKPFLADTNNNNRRLSTIISVLLLLVICCCCSFTLFMYYYGGDWLLKQIGLLP